MSERDTIIQQFVKFCMLHTEIPEINDYIYPSESCKAIGDRTGKFTISNYIGRYNETLENNNFTSKIHHDKLKHPLNKGVDCLWWR